MRESILALLVTGLFLWACAVVGHALLRLFRFSVNAKESFLFTVPLGMGAYGWMMFWLGLWGGFYSWIAWLMVLAPLPLGFLRKWRPVVRWSPFALKGMDRLLFLLLCVEGGTLILQGLQPVYSFDALSHYLAIPASCVRHHRIVEFIFPMFTWLPNHMGMLYTLALLLQGDLVASLINVCSGLLTAGVLVLWGRRTFSLRVGLSAAVIFLSLSITRDMTANFWIDSGLVMYVVLALFMAHRAFEERSLRGWAIGGLFAGCAGAVKLYGLMLLPIFVVMLARCYARDLRRLGVALGAVFVAYLVVPGGWYARSGYGTGNPLFPFFNDFFSLRPEWRNGDKERHAIHLAQYGGKERGWFDLLRLPYRVLVEPLRLQQRVDYLMWPFYTILVWYLVRVRKGHSAIRILGGMTLAWVLMWFFELGHLLRYLYPAIPLFCLLMAGMTYRIALVRSRLEGWVAAFVPSFLVLLMMVWHSRHVPRAFRVASGLESREAFLHNIFRDLDSEGLHSANLYIRDRTPPHGCVLLVAEVRGYYTEREFFWGGLDDPSGRDTFQRSLRSRGVMYVLHDVHHPVGRYAPLEKWAERYGKLVFAPGVYRVYRVNP